ncbi:hypothetical protein MBLNU230_g5754t1 [Neophaeotheca triangularis]
MPPWPEVAGSYHRRLGHDVTYTAHGHRYLSPSNSGSSQVSSGWSDGQVASPKLSDLDNMYSPRLVPRDIPLYGFDGYSGQSGPASYHCVSMQDVQQYEDDQPEAYDDEQHCFGNCPQEGYRPLQTQTTYDHAPSQYHLDCQPRAPEEPPTNNTPQPNIKRRRTKQPKPLTSPTPSPKKPKRPHPKRLNTQPTKLRPNRPFTCPFAPYGCPSTFTSKNEWKRHISTQHLRLGFYRCRHCSTRPTNPETNDFNRKDLFVQHIRRMHGERLEGESGEGEGGESGVLAGECERCYVWQRDLPAESLCLFCEERFLGLGGWERRLEHLAAHMVEGDGKGGQGLAGVGEWRRDEGLEEWFVREGIVGRRGERVWLVEKD